jgi:hypothetical protein
VDRIERRVDRLWYVVIAVLAVQVLGWGYLFLRLLQN